MNMKKGFTLVELLVAATIIGMLAVFATSQYRESVAETRWAHAKALTSQLAMAVQQAQLDYPGLSFYATAMANTTERDCPYYPGVSGSVSGQSLIMCNYLENADWSGGKQYFAYYICPNGNASYNANCRTGDYLACAVVLSTARMPSKYQDYAYCVGETTGGVEFTTK